MEHDAEFGITIEALLTKLEEIRDGPPSVAGIDLQGAKGVQVGNRNTQINTFN